MPTCAHGHPSGWHPGPTHLSRMLALAWVAVVLPACADTVFYTPLAVSPRPLSPRPVDQVETFILTPPARPHTSLVLFQIVRGGNTHTVIDMIQALRQRAADTGCDGLMVTSIDQRENRHQQTSIQATCLVYNDVPGSQTNQSSAPVATAPAAAAATPAAPPPPRSALITTSPGEVRTAPYVVAPLLIRLDSGKRISVSSQATDGWRIVLMPDGRVGYIQDASIRLE